MTFSKRYLGKPNLKILIPKETLEYTVAVFKTTVILTNYNG
jgi:hypothetical protein